MASTSVSGSSKKDNEESMIWDEGVSCIFYYLQTEFIMLYNFGFGLIYAHTF